MSEHTKRKYLQHNGIYFAGSMVIGALNYAYYPLLGRLLRVETFGEVQVLFSLLTEAGILYAALGLVLVHAVVNKTREDAILLLEEIEKLGLAIFIPLTVVWLLAVPAISHFLHFDDRMALAVFFIAIVTTFFISTRQAVVQGCEGFGHVMATGVTGAALKLGASIALVWIGWGVLGAIGGLLIAQAVMLGYIVYVSRRFGFPVHPKLRVHISWTTLAGEMHYVVPIVIVSLVVTALFSSDIIIVKHLFTPEAAGQYAGVAAIARIIIFLTTPFAAVLFTKVKPTASRRDNHAALRLSLGLLLLMGGSATALMVAAPRWLIGLLLGSRYIAEAAVLPWLAFALLSLSVMNLLAYYDLALRRKAVVYIMLVGLLEGSVLVVVHHTTVLHVVVDILLASVTMVVMRLALTLHNRLRHQPYEDKI